MLEVYVILSLGALGYLMNSMGSQVKPKRQALHKFESPSMKNAYESKHVEASARAERQLAERAYREALAPRKTNRVMTMAGELVDSSTFTHNNMEPYFGGRVRQNLDEDRNRALLENFTGVSDIKKQKCEVKSFYDRSEHMGNVYGMANQDAFYRDRIEQPRARNNELPVDQVRVGPGLNQGYKAEPTGGFQQYDAGEIARQAEKCVDQLRVKTKPKETFDARTVDGVKAKLPGLEGQLAKNRVDRYYEQGEDRWLKTTGANLKQKMTPKFNVKATHRLSTTKYYGGTARGRDGRRLDARVERTARQQFTVDGVRNAVLSALGLGAKDDYGKGNVVVYQNERDLTTTRTYQGNLTSLIKAVVAPLQDLVKNTKKQESVDNPRHFGAIAPQMPEKPTVYDPNDTARATLKEQLIDAVDSANLKGPEKLTIYDPDDSARTTLKEQLIHDSVVGNLKPARPVQLTIYDPTDTARTTLKEVALHDEIGTGTLTGPKEIYVYDPDEIAKRTVRETLREVDYSANVATSFKHSKLPFDDEARVTIKQTTQDNLYDAGPDALEGAGAYEVTDYTAPATQKAFLSDRDYTGGAARDLGEGYQTNEHEARTTQKEFLSDRDYYGVSDGANKKQRSQEQYDNAHVDERKESTLFDRQPTAQGAKQFNDCVNVRIKKEDCTGDRATQNVDRVYQTGPQMSDRQLTKQRLAVDLDSRLGLDRIDPDLLKAFRENEYTQPLDSAV